MGKSSLHWAADINNKILADLLIQKGAFVNAKDNVNIYIYIYIYYYNTLLNLFICTYIFIERQNSSS